MEHIASRRKTWFAISAALLIPCILALVIHGLNFGIDFTGGTAWEIQYTEAVDTEKIVSVLADNGLPNARVQQIGESDKHQYLIRDRKSVV